MDIKEKAKNFALKAHLGQVRKSEPDKPMILHPLNVGNILASYGYDDFVVAAGYLHDVVEDTSYTLPDIEKEFGQDVANLVSGASEPDKSLSWEERKKHTIRTIKDLPLRNRLVICADKISNLEDLALTFAKTGQRDFSVFKKGEEYQKWYYTSVYESLIKDVDANLPIFKRLKEVLDDVFYPQEDMFLKEEIFVGKEEYYQKLKQLHAQKLELEKLKTLTNLTKPFVIEFSGTPRSGKTTTLNNLEEFFKKGGFDTLLIHEFTTSKYYQENLKKADLSPVDKNIAIIEEVAKELQEALTLNKDLILIDRSLNDRQIWNYRLLVNQKIDKAKYQELRQKYLNLSKELIDVLVIMYTDPLTSLKRDYLASLALEKRSFLNMDNIESFNESLKALDGLFNEAVLEKIIVDTTNMNLNDAEVFVASKILPVMRTRYLKEFKDKNNVN